MKWNSVKDLGENLAPEAVQKYYLVLKQVVDYMSMADVCQTAHGRTMPGVGISVLKSLEQNLSLTQYFVGKLEGIDKSCIESNTCKSTDGEELWSGGS